MTQEQVNINRGKMYKAVNNLYEVMSIERESIPEVDKGILYQSEHVVIQQTKLKKNGTHEIKDTPFNAQLVLAEGKIDVTHNKKTTELSKANRVMDLPVGADADSIAKEDTTVLTIIDLD